MMGLFFENIDKVAIALGIIIVLLYQWRRNGTISLQDLKDAVEIGVKAAEIEFIKDGGVEDNRKRRAYIIICDLLGVEAPSQALMDKIDDAINFVLNDLPKTSLRLKQEKGGK